MVEYLLLYGQPRLSSHAPPVIYEAKRLRAAIRWALDQVPNLHGIPTAETAYPAVPMALWRVKPTGRKLVWEGMALRAIG